MENTESTDSGTLNEDDEWNEEEKLGDDKKKRGIPNHCAHSNLTNSQKRECPERLDQICPLVAIAERHQYEVW